MARENPAFLVVGHLNKAHGVGGDLYVWPLTDRPDSTFVPGVTFHLGDESGSRPDRRLPDLTVEAVRPYKKGFLIKFEQVDDRTAAELFRGRYLLRAFEEAEPLADDEVFYHQLLGMEAVTRDGDLVGEVAEVYELSPADMLEVRGPTGSVLIPYTSQVVVEVDVEEGRIVISPPEGLLEL